ARARGGSAEARRAAAAPGARRRIADARAGVAVLAHSARAGHAHAAAAVARAARGPAARGHADARSAEVRAAAAAARAAGRGCTRRRARAGRRGPPPRARRAKRAEPSSKSPYERSTLGWVVFHPAVGDFFGSRSMTSPMPSGDEAPKAARPAKKPREAGLELA